MSTLSATPRRRRPKAQKAAVARTSQPRELSFSEREQAIAQAAINAFISQHLPERDQKMAQAGADAAVAWLAENGHLNTGPIEIRIVGMPDRLKVLHRNAAGLIEGVLESDSTSAA